MFIFLNIFVFPFLFLAFLLNHEDIDFNYVGGLVYSIFDYLSDVGGLGQK